MQRYGVYVRLPEGSNSKSPYVRCNYMLHACILVHDMCRVQDHNSVSPYEWDAGSHDNNSVFL